MSSNQTLFSLCFSSVRYFFFALLYLISFFSSSLLLSLTWQSFPCIHLLLDTRQLIHILCPQGIRFAKINHHHSIQWNIFFELIFCCFHYHGCCGWTVCNKIKIIKRRRRRDNKFLSKTTENISFFLRIVRQQMFVVMAPEDDVDE